MADQRSGDGALEHDGNFCSLHLARSDAPQGPLRGDLADFFRRLQLLQRHRDRIPVVALHRRAFDLRDGYGRNRAIGALVVADEPVRIGQHLVADGGVEGAALGVDDARVGVEGRFLGTARVVDAIGGGKRVDIVVIKVEVALKFAELRNFWNSGERILAGDLSQRQRRVHQLLHAFRRQIAGVGAGGALSEKNTDADGLGAGFLQRLHFAETDHGGEFAAVHGDGFSGGSSALHGAADNVGRNFLQICRARLGSDFAFLGRKIHKIKFVP